MANFIVNGKFLAQSITGVQRYARGMLMALDKLVKDGDIEIAIPNNVIDIPKYQNIAVNQIGKCNGVLWEQIELPIYSKKKKATLINFCNAAPLICPGIVCVHDMGVRAHPEHYGKKFVAWYKLVFYTYSRRAGLILTDSIFSKNEIMKYYPFIKADRITIIPCAWQHYLNIKADENAVTKYGLKKHEYFFSMSSLSANKNLQWICDTARNNPGYTFAISGVKDDKVFGMNLYSDIPLNVKMLGYVSDGEAKELIKECLMFIFPTFYEGFGIPPMEALSVGAKIIVSDIEVMHEIYGETANYVDPQIPCKDISKLIVIDNRKASEILYKYSWDKSAEQLLVILRKGNYIW